MKAPIFSAYAPSIYDAQRIIYKMAMCRRCSGSGISSRNAAADCQACNGTGKRQDVLATTASRNEHPATINCPKCNGAGCQHDVPPGQPVHGGDIYECYHCEGTGQVPAPLTDTASPSEQPAPEPICSYTGLPMKHCLCGLDGCSSLKANA